MKVWSCTKCNQMIPSNTVPNSTHCPAGGNHQWSLLTSDGDVVPRPNLKAWQCRLCGALVYSKYIPNSNRCPKSRGNHSWVLVTR